MKFTGIFEIDLSYGLNEKLRKYDDLSTGVPIETILRACILEVIDTGINESRELTDAYIRKFFNWCEYNYWKEHVSNDDSFEVMVRTGEIYKLFKQKIVSIAKVVNSDLFSSNVTVKPIYKITPTDVTVKISQPDKDILHVQFTIDK